PILAAALVSIGLVAGPAAQAQTLSSGEAHSSIGVPVGGSQILRFDRPVGQVYLGNSEVADVIALSDRSIYVLGKEAGSSSLTIMERGQRSTPMATYTINVGVDAIGLRRTLHEVMPGEDIEVRLAGDGLILSGAASSSAAADRATSIAARFAGDRVVNSMTIAAAEQVMLEV